jgi:YbbR domain-containing protein
MSSASFFRRHLTHNLGLKVISLLLAIVLWLMIGTGRLH